MSEPEQLHNFAYHPNVASWVQSTSLAQFDGPPEQPVDEEPDVFYQQSYQYTTTDPEGLSVSAAEMATSRQRQQAPNGAARSTTKPSIRAVSGPASSTTSTPRAPPPGSAGNVKSLAQKFNQVAAPTDSSPPPLRIRSTRPSPSPASSTKTPASNSFSPARPAKQASYGNHTFSNLKPRERPQPAPASPAGIRRTNGRRPSTTEEQQTTPSRQKVSSPTRGPKKADAAPRQPFFGEVIGEHDEVTPGFGIPSPTAESDTREADMGGSPRHRRERSDATALTEKSIDDVLSTTTTTTSQTPRRHSPPSRIPVAARRRSITSDSGSSTQSHKGRGSNMRPSALKTHQRASPTRLTKPQPPPSTRERAGAGPKIPSKVPARRPVASPPLLPSTRYGHSRGKSPKASGNNTSLNAVISAPPPPTSPRLRHSRESGLLSPRSSESRSRSVDPRPSDPEEHVQTSPRIRNNSISVETLQHSDPDHGAATLEAAHEMRQALEDEGPFGPAAGQSEQQDVTPASQRHSPLALLTAEHATHPPAPRSSTTDFEAESPVLGMPGSFMMTPPIAQDTSTPRTTYVEEQPAESKSPRAAHGELLQARAFERASNAPQSQDLSYLQSELGVRESIPIMFDDDQREWEAAAHSPTSDVDINRWRADPLDSSGTIAYLDEIDDYPNESFVPSNRDSLRPDDSASMAFYHRPAPEWTPRIPSKPDAGDLTLDSEAYSVINKILNMYHGSSTITPEMAYDSQRQIHKVSPIIAQHTDWGSKETTETYLARLLSDATIREAHDFGHEDMNVNSVNPAANKRMPSLHIQEADDSSEASIGGTAVIFPTESRRYSRGSRGSTATTIQDDASRPDSASMNYTRDPAQGDFPPQVHHTYSNAPQPPPKDWWNPSPTDFYYGQGHNYSPVEPLKAPVVPVLPEIKSAGEGLGLSLHAHQPYSAHQPPRPSYSPPPPPPPIPPIPEGILKAEATVPAQPSPQQYTSETSLYNFAPVRAQGTAIRPPKFTRGKTEVERRDVDEPVKVPYHSASDPAIKPVATPPAMGIYPSVPAQAEPGAAESASVDAVEISPALRKRHHILKELINTECGFACDMMVIYEIFQKTSDSILSDRERRTLFSNSREISTFSYGLYRALKRAVKPLLQRTTPLREDSVDDGDSTRQSMAQEVLVKELADTTKEQDNPLAMLCPENDRLTTIGAAMNEHLPRMERLYTTYLLNNDDATAFLIANGKTSKILGWQMACIKGAHGLTQAWDLNSLIVKPVQRLLKYPLLLTDLLGCTPEDHPDYAALKAARDEVIKISERVNAAKKRQDTLRAATQEGKKKESKAPRGKNWVKALSGANKKPTKTDASLAKTFDDPQYNFLAQKFGGHFFQLQIVLRDIEKYLDDITGFMATTNSLIISYIGMLDCAPTSDPTIESTWRRQAMAFVELQTVALEDHKSAVRVKIIKPILELWNLHSRPQKLMEQRKKGLGPYCKYKVASERKEKIDSKVQETADTFITINNTLKDELPKLYLMTKTAIIACLQSFISYQNSWWRNCQKKILPLLEYEPEHTTSFTYDLKAYVDRFQSDFTSYQAQAWNLDIVNRTALGDAQKLFSPMQSLYSDEASSRKSSSRRTESIGSDISTPDPRNRRSDGFSRQRTGTGAELPYFDGPPRSSPQARYISAPVNPARTLSPISDKSDDTATQQSAKYKSLDSTMDEPDNSYGRLQQPEYMTATHSAPTSYPNSHRGSAVFNSAVPMSISDSPTQLSHQISNQLAHAESLNSSAYDNFRPGVELPASPPADLDEPDVLFLAASLFEFNIAHDRREGGIPYLVYVPGEIFDVIGMKGELWLARNQDDASRTVGWIWEKHFARILPDEA